MDLVIAASLLMLLLLVGLCLFLLAAEGRT